MPVGLIVGTALPPDILEISDSIGTDYGETSSPIWDLELGKNAFKVINRHGNPPRIPPHMVNHRANIKALVDEGVTSVISICSSGALKEDLEVPSLAVPDDYIDLFSGATFHDRDIVHITPSLDRNLSGTLIDACKGSDLRVYPGGTYVQTRGPRLETRSEVSLISKWGDYVGMNLGPEATLANEAGISLASILTVDNYAHGIGEVPEYAKIKERSMSKWSVIEGILSSIEI